MFKKLITLAAGAALLSALVPALAQANVVTGNMNVTAVQFQPCTVTKPADLSFGKNNFAEGASVNESQGTGGHPGELDLTCGDDLTTIGFDNGLHYSAGIRHMQDTAGTAQISYKLCQAEPAPGGDCNDWNNTTNTLQLADGRNGGLETNTDKVMVYGLVPDGSQNDQHDATYTDVVGYTISVNV